GEAPTGSAAGSFPAYSEPGQSRSSTSAHGAAGIIAPVHAIAGGCQILSPCQAALRRATLTGEAASSPSTSSVESARGYGPLWNGDVKCRHALLAAAAGPSRLGAALPVLAPSVGPTRGAGSAGWLEMRPVLRPQSGRADVPGRAEHPGYGCDHARLV